MTTNIVMKNIFLKLKYSEVQYSENLHNFNYDLSFSPERIKN